MASERQRRAAVHNLIAARAAHTRLIDRAGERHGRLVVLERAQGMGKRRVYWRCQCDCGRTTLVVADKLSSGKTRSCGCLMADGIRARSLTHGHTQNRRPTPEYKAWLHAKGRCYTTTDAKYPIYGGRGIVMSDRWKDDFDAFLADMGPRPDGRSLDRIDVNGPYSPENCRWATPATQANNTRGNIRVAIDGVELTLKEAARKYGVNYKALHHAVRYKRADAEATLRLLIQRKG